MGIYVDRFIVFADGRVGTIKKAIEKDQTVEVYVEREKEPRIILIEKIKYDTGIYVERTIGKTDTVKPDPKKRTGGL